MTQNKEKNRQYEGKFSLSSLYQLNELKKLFLIIPELSALFQSQSKINLNPKTKINSNNAAAGMINMSDYIKKINKFSFIRIILSKLKSYFEVNESFIIMKTIAIIINEIRALEEFVNMNSQRSKYMPFHQQKDDITFDKANNSLFKFEKIKKTNNKNMMLNRGNIMKNNGMYNTTNNSITDLTESINDTNNNIKQKLYYKETTNYFKKPFQPETNSKGNNNHKKTKHICINLNETERRLGNIKLSLCELKKYKIQKLISGQKTHHNDILKLYVDSHISESTQNLTSNISFNNNSIDKNSARTLKNDTNNSCKTTTKRNEGTQKEKFGFKNKIESNVEIKMNNNELNPIYNNLNAFLLNNIETEDFDIFELDKKSSRKCLLIIGCYIFNRFGFNNIIKYSIFENWCKKITEGYNRNNPYHTDIHAGDVTQTCLVFFKKGKINEICQLTQISKCSLFLSCICHDYKHPGVNNNFLTESKNILAVKYNDNSVLENMHISETFKLMVDDPNCDIFSSTSPEIYKQMRKEMISCVLYTDMIKHPNSMDFMKQMINNSNNGKIETKNMNQEYMNLLIHSSDISNPTKKFDIYWKWATAVVEEFLRQGDKEKELGIKCTFDRETLTIYQNQIGFIDYVEIPFFSSYTVLFPRLKYLMDNLNNNKSKVLELKEKDKKKNELNHDNKNKKLKIDNFFCASN